MAHQIPRLAPMLTASVVLTACAVGPHYTPPAPPQEHAFYNAPLARGLGADRDAPPLEAWWTGFADPELTVLVERALAQNLDLAQAEARVLQARAQARAAGAAALPAAELGAQGEYQHQSLANPSARLESVFPGYSRNQKLYDLGLNGGWEADLFGGLRRGAQAARAQFQASEAARNGARLAVAAETADAYIQVRALQARLRAAEDDVAARGEIARLVELQASRGVAAAADVENARGGLAGAKAQASGLRAGLEAQTVALEILVGVTPGSLHSELQSPANIPRPPAVSVADGPTSLLRRRPDIIAAERNLAAADARIGAAIADYYPKVTFSGVLGYEASDIGQLVGPAAFQPQGIVGIRWRLFDFGRIDAEVAAARGARAEALAAYRSSVLKATGDVETALAALFHDEAQARTLAEGETSLASSRAAAQAAYAAGQSSRIAVLDADDRLLAARDQRLQADALASRSAIATYKALGGGWSAGHGKPRAT